MNYSFQQFAWIDALLSNWDGIRVRMGNPEAALETELAKILQQLSGAQSADEIALLIDHLLDRLEQTAAYDYVLDLIERANVSDRATHRSGTRRTATVVVTDAELASAASGLARAPLKKTAFTRVPVFFVTNRKACPDKIIGHRFAGEYAKELSYGLAHVTIPADHRPGKIERPLPLIGSESKEHHIVLANLRTLRAPQFATCLAQKVERSAERELLIFLHGYNVTFEEAARRAAQFATDLQFHGTVVLFSWPSAGATRLYLADEDSAAKSAEPLNQFLHELQNGPWTKVHIVAHSMGNRVLVSGLAASAELALPLRNVVLVAADVDTELFEQQFPRLHDVVRRNPENLATSYATESDRALWFSRFFHKTNRLGRITGEPFVTDGLETIDASAVDTSLLSLRHGYFSDKQSVLADIRLLLRTGRRAAERDLIGVKKWWAIRK
jgi:esterase/lipase superfamily enzyme